MINQPWNFSACFKQCTEPPLPLKILPSQIWNLITPNPYHAYAHLPHHHGKKFGTKGRRICFGPLGVITLWLPPTKYINEYFPQEHWAEYCGSPPAEDSKEEAPLNSLRLLSASLHSYLFLVIKTVLFVFISRKFLYGQNCRDGHPPDFLRQCINDAIANIYARKRL